MLAACSVAYVAVRLVEYRAELAAAEVPPAVWLALPALLYAAAGVLLACAWRELLAAAGQHVALRWSVTTHGLSQLGKYLPGNVFQFVSRQFIGAAGGLPHGVLVRSSLHELLGLAAAGVLLSVWALPLLDNRLGWLSAPPVAGLTLGALAGPGCWPARGLPGPSPRICCFCWPLPASFWRCSACSRCSRRRPDGCRSAGPTRPPGWLVSPRPAPRRGWASASWRCWCCSAGR